MKPDLGILVLSCDKFADLWKPFFTLFEENRNNCPYPVYLGSNTVRYEDSQVKTLYSGEDRDWSTSCRSILQQIPHKYVLVLLEDCFIISKLDVEKITQSVQFMQDNNAKHIHFRPVPKPDKWLPNQEMGVYEKRAPYRVNAVGFWDRAYLLNLLIDGESPWNLEIQGSYRTAYDDGFYCPKQPLFSHVHVVEKGCWFPEAIAYCQEHDIPLEIDKRPILKNQFQLKSKLQMYYFNLMIKVPWKFRVKCMDILRKLLISY